MIKKILLISCLTVYRFCVSAQQPVFTDYYFNPVFYNAAFTGNKNAVSMSAQYKMQWREIEMSPSTALVTAHSPINTSASSIGISLYKDAFAYTGTTGAVISYAYRHPIKEGQLSAGVQTSVENYTHTLTAAHPGISNDPALATDINLFHANAGVGVAWETDKGFFGIAVPKLFSNTVSESDTSHASGTVQQFNISGTYSIALNKRWNLAPSLLFTYIETLPSQLDLQLHFIYDTTLEMHIGFRSNSIYSGGIRYHVWKNLQVGYSFDYYTGTFGSASGGGHEISIGYDLLKKKGE